MIRAGDKIICMNVTLKNVRSRLRALVTAIVVAFIPYGSCSVHAEGIGISLEDSELNEKFQEAREYRLSPICYHDNTFLDSNKEIGPSGVRHTLAGMEFPWKHPGGRFRSDMTRKFVWPRDIQAKTSEKSYKPVSNSHVVVRTGPFGRQILAPRQRWTRPAWSWPVGSVFFEVHYHPGGWPFELRALEKINEGDDFSAYEPRIFRPFGDPEQLPFTIESRKETLEITSNHPKNAFTASETVHFYPDTNVDWDWMVKQKPWVDDLGHVWHHAGDGHRWLSPKGYAGWVVGAGERCADCHSTTGKPVDYFDVPGRDCYGS